MKDSNSATSPDVLAQAAAAPAMSSPWIWPLLLLAAAAFYAALWNPYWVPGGDSDFYLAVARNLATGRHFTWNGDPVGISPPGWPIVLAGALKISASFGFLKVFAIFLMVGFWGVVYFVLRRFAAPAKAAGVILLCVCISHAYSLTFWSHSDPLFALLCAGAVLVAMQINEGRPLAWRLPALLLLCWASVTVRWLGAANWLLVAGVLLHGRVPWRWRDIFPARWAMDRRWVALLLTAVVTLYTLRWALNWNKAASAPVRAAQTEALTEESQTPDMTLIGAEHAKKTDKLESIEHVYSSGKWFSWLFWQPLRFTSVNIWTDLPGAILGFGLIAALGMSVVRGVRSRQWIWLALAVYCGAMIAFWPNPVPRYLVPMLPLLSLAVLDAIAALAPPGCGPRRRQISSILYKGFVATVVLCNLALWGIDVWVFHSSNFYARYEAGINQDLIAATRYLRANTVPSERIAVSTRYDNLGRMQRSFYAPRVVVLLADRKAVSVPPHVGMQPNVSAEDDKRLLRWSTENNTQLYLYQPPVNPWRVWHFRVPPWLQRRMAQRPEDRIRLGNADTAGWQLWEVRHGARAQRIALADWKDWPRSVPGL